MRHLPQNESDRAGRCPRHGHERAPKLPGEVEGGADGIGDCRPAPGPARAARGPPARTPGCRGHPVRKPAADPGGARRHRQLLFLLATSPPLTREQLGVALWPDQSREQLGNALHTALRGLRRALGDPGWALYSDGRYAFNRSRPHDSDVETFEQALAAARRARPAAAALPDLQRAIAAYNGDFLADMTAGGWAQ